MGSHELAQCPECRVVEYEEPVTGLEHRTADIAAPFGLYGPFEPTVQTRKQKIREGIAPDQKVIEPGMPIGTSTNVAVSGYLVQHGFKPLSLFELLPIGLIMLGVGILYMLGVSRYLLPDHRDENLPEDFVGSIRTPILAVLTL